MKEKKRTLEIFSYNDCSRLEKHLTQMAEKGWLFIFLLEAVKFASILFRKIV